MSDDEDLDRMLQEFLEACPKVYPSARDGLRCDVRSVSSGMDGTLEPAFQQDEAAPRGLTRKRFIQDARATIAVFCGGLMPPAIRKLAPALGSGFIGGALGGAGGDLLTDIRKGDAANFGVSPGFVHDLSRLPYTSTEINQLKCKNDGESALVSSLLNHASGENYLDQLQNNLEKLEKVISSNDNIDVKNFARARRAADLFRLGAENFGLDELAKIDVARGQHPVVHAAMLEYVSALTLSALHENDFVHFNDDRVVRVVALARPYLSDVPRMLDRGDAGILGMSLSSAIQAMYIAKFTDRTISRSAASDLHREWVGLYRRCAEAYRSGESSTHSHMAKSFASDYIHSMTRVAYHAAAWSNFDLALAITDWAVGHGRSDDSEHIIEARHRINDTLNQNARWMWLLRIALIRKLGHPPVGKEFRDLRPMADNLPGSHPILFALRVADRNAGAYLRTMNYLDMPGVGVARAYIKTLDHVTRS